MTFLNVEFNFKQNYFGIHCSYMANLTVCIQFSIFLPKNSINNNYYYYCLMPNNQRGIYLCEIAGAATYAVPVLWSPRSPD